MDSMTKNMMKTQISALSAQSQAFQATLAGAIAGAVATGVSGPPGAPVIIPLGPPLQLLNNALKMQAENFDKLLKLVEEVITKS